MLVEVVVDEVVVEVVVVNSTAIYAQSWHELRQLSLRAFSP